ncbi:FAD-linked sulfhydryl oxidase ERV1 [Cucumis sativus]|uniref:Sulfhydryl oxidase n=1 Tax=Cucumis sativus TaxID=3659 RepID=A0A0A0KY47_CUCSA|nr:FAD-linked sulfhydryl oxidase ERV1 [Cucumis sativus]
MSENPIQSLFQIAQKISTSIETHLSNLLSHSTPHSRSNHKPLSSPFSSSYATPSYPDTTSMQSIDVIHTPAAPVTKEVLGRATWTFLHILAAQYPDHPTRQQKKDVKELMAILSRMYPCGECADHFKEVLRANPVETGSHADFSRWLCRVHNVVNRSLGKPIFPCERVDARWGKLECEQRACDVLGSLPNFGEEDRH